MGIYVQGYGIIPTSAPDKFASRLIASAESWAADRGLSDLFYGYPTDTGAWLTFYPPAGGIAFDIDSGRIGFGVKTSIAGPGYHAALIDLCDHLQAQLGIAWRWDSGGDETNYARERSFAKLRECFLDQVFAYCEFHRDHVKSGETHAINLSEGWMANGCEGVATPLGPVPGQLFLDALEDPADEVILARRIFPWWSPAIDDELRINTLHALLWTEVVWRAPRTPWECHVHGAAHSLADHLQSKLDPPLRQAMNELASLSGDTETFIAPAAEDIGYLKRRRAFFFGGGWRVNLPGYYIEHVEDEGDTICFWFGDEEIRGSSFIMRPKEGQAETNLGWHEDLADQPDREGDGFTYRCDPVARPSTNCPGYFSARAEFQTLNRDGTWNLLILSIFSAGQDVASRLKEIAKGVWLQPPSRGAGDHAH